MQMLVDGRFSNDINAGILVNKISRLETLNKKIKGN